MPALALWLGCASVGTGQAVAPPPLSENLVDHDEAMLEALWKTTDDIASSGLSWAECRRELETALAEHATSNEVETAQRFRLSILLAEQREAALTDHPSDDPFDLLVRTTIEAILVANPLQFRSGTQTYMWDRGAEPPEHPDMDPAYRIYKRGRSAIPRLLALLGDHTATRSARYRSSIHTRPPDLMCVGDVALALIEGIAHCRFCTDGVQYRPYTLLSEPQQEAIRAEVNQWLEATEGMSRIEAIVWQIEHGEPSRSNFMIDVLLQMKENEAAIRCLRSRYRNDDSINYSQAIKMINAGSREPLEFIHQVVAEGRQLNATMVRLIGAKGSPADCEMLRDVMLAPDPQGSHVAGRDTGGLNQMNMLKMTNNPNCVPVFVAVILHHLGVDETSGEIPTPDGPVPKDVYESAWAVQRITEVGFGLKSDDAASQQNQALLNRTLVNIAEWWRTDGRAIYGFSRVDPHAPAGIR